MATVQDARGRGEEEEQGDQERRKRTLLNRIFNHRLSFAMASQSFTIAQERWRKRRIKGGERE